MNPTDNSDRKGKERKKERKKEKKAFLLSCGSELIRNEKTLFVFAQPKYCDASSTDCGDGKTSRTNRTL
jgi:hypothetical protein